LNTTKDLLEYIQSRFLSSCNSIKAFDFSTLYTTIPYPKQKENLKELVQLCFSKTNGQRIYKYLVLGRNISYFVTTITVILPKRSLKLISSTSSSFFIDNIFVIFSGRFFNKHTTYRWVQTVFLFSLTCSFIRMRQTSYRGFTSKAKRS
jgi:hypothetical protein